MKQLVAWLEEARPEIVGGLVVTAIVAAAGFLTSVLTRLGVWGYLLVGAIGVWIGATYLALKRIPSPLITGRRTWKYPRLRLTAIIVMVAIPVLLLDSAGYLVYQRIKPTNKILVLIADFDGPDPERYRVTETVLSGVIDALVPYSDTEVEALGRVIKENQTDLPTGKTGSDAARAEGKSRKASIVIWGWYGVTSETVALSVHVEMLRPALYVPLENLQTHGEIRRARLQELESFDLQIQLSKELEYLSLVVTGLARYSAGDVNGATNLFEDALARKPADLPSIMNATIFFELGNAYIKRDMLAEAIQAYNQALSMDPTLVVALSNLGVAYYQTGELLKAEEVLTRARLMNPYDAAITYMLGALKLQQGVHTEAEALFLDALTLDPNLPEPHYGLGVVYRFQGKKDLAIAEFEAFLKAPNVHDPQARAFAERELKALRGQ